MPYEDDGTHITGYLMDTDGALCADPNTGKYAVHMDAELMVGTKATRGWNTYKNVLKTTGKVVSLFI